MKPRQIVLCGLVVTALCTALLVSDFIPALAVGFLALGLGTVLSYYIALSQQRGNLLGEIETRDRLLEKIQTAEDTRGALRQLCIWSNWLAGSEDALLWLEDQGVIAETTPGGGEEWTLLAEGLEYGTTVFTVDHHTVVNRLPELSPPTWSELLVVNDTLTGGSRLVLFLLNPTQRVGQEATLFRLLHYTRYLLERELGSRGFIDEYQQLLGIALNATEPGEAFRGHSQRVLTLALALGHRLRLSEEESKILEYAALLHDIGKALDPAEDGSPQEKNRDSEELETDETTAARDHASLGAALIPDEGLWHEVREAVLYHHERYDGSGFPAGLKRYDIPLASRIIAVADVYDALTWLAPEEERLKAEAALGAIKRATGIWFDPLVVVAMEENFTADKP